MNEEIIDYLYFLHKFYYESVCAQCFTENFDFLIHLSWEIISVEVVTQVSFDTSSLKDSA